MAAHRLLGDSRGLTTVEYALVLCLVAVVAYPAWHGLGGTIAEKVAGVEASLGDLPGTGTGTGTGTGSVRWASIAGVGAGRSRAALGAGGGSGSRTLGLASGSGDEHSRRRYGRPVGSARLRRAAASGRLRGAFLLGGNGSGVGVGSGNGETARGNLARSADQLRDRADGQSDGTFDQVQAGLYDAAAGMLDTVGAVGDMAGTFAAWVVHGGDRWQDSKDMASGAAVAARRFAEDPMAPVQAAIEHCTGSVRTATNCTVQAAGGALGVAKTGVAVTRAAMEGGTARSAAVVAARKSRGDEDVAEGDLVPGDHLVTPRALYRHHGIYLGSGRVIHYARPRRAGDGTARAAEPGSRATVRESPLEEFAGGQGFKVRNRDARVRPPAEAAGRAQERLGEDNYSVVFRNCEHFAEWCVHGKARSGQSAIGIGAAVGTGVVGGAVIAGGIADP